MVKHRFSSKVPYGCSRYHGFHTCDSKEIHKPNFVVLYNFIPILLLHQYISCIETNEQTPRAAPLFQYRCAECVLVCGHGCRTEKIPIALYAMRMLSYFKFYIYAVVADGYLINNVIKNIINNRVWRAFQSLVNRFSCIL